MSFRVPAIHSSALIQVTALLTLLNMGIIGCLNQLEPLEPLPLPIPSPAEPAHEQPPVKSRLPEIQFTIQAGAFKTPERAARYMDALQAAGVDAYYFIDSDGLSKVRFERFDTREAAHARALALKSRGLIEDYFVAQPRVEKAIAENRMSDPQAALQEGLVNTARRFVGTAYRWGGNSAHDGFDCSGLTMTVYRLNGLDLPRSSFAQYRAGTPVASAELKEGDLVFFATNGGSRVSHVGIYSGNGRFIHAPGKGKYIRSASLHNQYFKSRYKGARRYY